MATPGYFWMRRPVFEAMQYNGPEDLEDLRAWVATKNTEASETVVKRVEPNGDGFQFWTAWVWDQDREFLGQAGTPTDWVIYYYGSLNVFSNAQFTYDYEPSDVPPLPEPSAAESTPEA